MSRELTDAKWESWDRRNERAREQDERYTPAVFVKGPHFNRTRRDFNQQSQPDASWMPEHHNPKEPARA
jgi:hypothetical protein